jgi:hypothetical protein
VAIPVVTGATRTVTEGFTEESGNHSMRTFSRFTTERSYTRNIARNTESTAVWIFTPERWGSSLVRQKYQEKNLCDKRQQQQHDDDDDDDISHGLYKLTVTRKFLQIIFIFKSIVAVKFFHHLKVKFRRRTTSKGRLFLSVLYHGQQPIKLPSYVTSCISLPQFQNE